MWEFYTPRQGNTAAISKNHITLPQTMIDNLRSDHVALAFDKSNKKILIKGQGDGLKIANRKVLARQFLNFFDINEKGTYPCTYSEADAGVIVSL